MNFWNLNYDIAALVMLLVIIGFFVHTKWLPTYANRFFISAICMRIATVVMDIVACVMLTHYRDFGLVSLYCSNLLYFLFEFTAACLVLLFALQVTVKLTECPKSVVLLIKIIYAVCMIVICSTVWNHWLFGIDEKGYYNGFGYEIFKVVNFFIVLTTLVIAITRRKDILRIQLLSFGMYAALHFVGLVILLGVSPMTPVGGMTSALGLLIIFLAFQNPDKYVDAKTGLFNRRGLIRMGQNDARARSSISLFCVQLTNYQNVSAFNDRRVIEQCMRQIGSWCKTTMNDFRCYYISKGRFVFAHNGEINTSVYKGMIRDRFSHPWKTDKGEITFTTSMQYFPNAISTVDAEEMVDCIEAAAEKYGHSGNASFRVMSDDIVKEIRRRREVTEAIEKAIEKRTVQVFYQPIFDCKTGKVNAVEALARLEDEKLGRIPPEEFIRLAEQNGSILDLGAQIFEKVCLFISKPEVKELGLERIDVNLSPIQCRYEWLVAEFRTIAFRHGTDFKNFNFEITESATVDEDHCVANITQINREGGSFSLDDYGTGYSNLVSIHTIPFEYIKLDKSIVWAYVEQKNDILRHITEMFTAQGFKVIAEGVENEKMVEALKKVGCTGLQGYYFAKPLREEEFIAYMKSGEYIADSAER